MYAILIPTKNKIFIWVEADFFVVFGDQLSCGIIDIDWLFQLFTFFKKFAPKQENRKIYIWIIGVYDMPVHEYYFIHNHDGDAQ